MIDFLSVFLSAISFMIKGFDFIGSTNLTFIFKLPNDPTGINNTNEHFYPLVMDNYIHYK